MALFDFLGDILGIGAEVYSANNQSDASKEAAQIQAASADKAISEQRRQYDLSRSDMAPWMASGRSALSRLDQLLGIGGGGRESRADFENRYNRPVGRDWSATERANIDRAYQNYLNTPQALPPGYGSLMADFTNADFVKDPGYNFRVGEGNKAIENSAAARGMQLSGANLKALNRYSQDFASNEFNNAYNRDLTNKNRKFNYLTGQSGTGSQVTANSAGLGANMAGNVAENYLQAGNARAAGEVGSANAWGNAIGNVTDYYRMRNLLRNSGRTGTGIV
jgi:hypothetical protein